MNDRGEYRAIRRVLLNGKDFRKLPERARFAFLSLKLNIGPSGIETFEPDALTATLAAQMGAKPDQVRVALDVLEHQGWLKREDNVIWVVGQLDHDPHVRASDPKHRLGVQRHVAGLPRLSIVREFVVAHADWFEGVADPMKGLPELSEPSSEGLARVLEGSSKGHRSTEDKDKTENKTENKPLKGPRPFVPPSGPVGEILAHHRLLHPRARHDAKSVTAAEKALAWGYEVADVNTALDGAAADPWCRKTGNTGIVYVCKDAETIAKYQLKGELLPSGPELIGGLPTDEFDRLTAPRSA